MRSVGIRAVAGRRYLFFDRVVLSARVGGTHFLRIHRKRNQQKVWLAHQRRGCAGVLFGRPRGSVWDRVAPPPAVLHRPNVCHHTRGNRVIVAGNHCPLHD